MHGKETLEVIVPVEEIGLKIHDTVEGNVGCLGTRQVEVGESGAAADRAGHNVVWM